MFHMHNVSVKLLLLQVSSNIMGHEGLLDPFFKSTPNSLKKILITYHHK